MKCGKPSTRHCDWKINSIKTCDAALCDDCTHETVTDMDLCPRHSQAWTGDVESEQTAARIGSSQTIEAIPRGWYRLLRPDATIRPGHFLDKSTAEFAKQFTDDTLTQLQDEANERVGCTFGVIWQKDLETVFASDSS